MQGLGELRQYDEKLGLRKKKRAAMSAEHRGQIDKAAEAGGAGAGIADMAVSSGNPYAMAAGLGLKALQASKKRKRAAQAAAIKAGKERKQNMTKGVDKMVGVAQSMSL